jgi:hypothetical protein
MNNSTVNADRIIKLPGLVPQTYCVLASVSASQKRNGTLWTDTDGLDYVVSSKNHHRLDNERSVISIVKSSANTTESLTALAEDSAETTAAGMFEIASVDDRYETMHRITSKDFQQISPNQWRSVVYGTPNLDTESPLVDIDPYVNLTQDEFILSATVGDTIRKDGSTHRPLDKEYRLESGNLYRVTVRSQANIQTGDRSFNRDDMFRTLAIGDTYIDSQGTWSVREKRVFYMETIGGINFYGREILVTTKAAD